MWKLRWRLKYLIVLAFLSCSMFYMLNIQGWHWYKMVEQIECETPTDYAYALRTLFRDAHEILDQFSLTHLLIYGRFILQLNLRSTYPALP